MLIRIALIMLAATLFTMPTVAEDNKTGEALGRIAGAFLGSRLGKNKSPHNAALYTVLGSEVFGQLGRKVKKRQPQYHYQQYQTQRAQSYGQYSPPNRQLPANCTTGTRDEEINGVTYKIKSVLCKDANGNWYVAK